MLGKVRKAIGHPVTQNVIALGWMQLATFIVPLITLPYVARVLRPSAFGLVVFSQGLAYVLVVFIDWGFGYTGIRATAEQQTDAHGLSTVVHRVRGAQLMLAAASVPIAIGALVLVPKMSHHPEFLVMAWVAAVATALAPGWFFVGTEKMRLIAFIQLGFRVLSAILTLTLVKSPDQAWLVMALFTAAAVAGWIASDVLMYRRISFQMPEFRASVREIRAATTIFMGTIAATLYTSFNVVLLGLFKSTTAVAHFGAAERIVRVSLTVMGPIGLAVLPRMTALQSQGKRDRARRLLTIAVAAAGCVALTLTAGLFLFAPTVIRILYGHRFVHDSVPLLRVLVWIIPISITGAVLGSWLITLHKDRLVARIVLRAGIMNVVLGCILTPLFGPVGMAWSVIIAEATAAIGGIITVRRDSRREAAAAAEKAAADASWHHTNGSSPNGFDSETPVNNGNRGGAEHPLVSVVFLAYNRRHELLQALEQTLRHSEYSALEVIVVDNASTDGTAEAVGERFPEVRLVRNEQNLGAPGWNAGFALARGDYILILDDDAYLRPGDLGRAVSAAEAEHAGLVSFSVVSAYDGTRRLNDDWQTGLLSYWGCAALVSRDAMRAIGGYDPNMFIWANEVDLTMRLLDHGFRHLHLPEIHAVHMKERIARFEPRRYLINARHHGYIAGKLMRPIDAAVVVANIIQQAIVDTVLGNRVALGAVKEVLVGCRLGLRQRSPVRPVVSAAYRRNFHPFAGPWPFTRSLKERLDSRRDAGAVAAQRTDRFASYYAERSAFYPTDRASLQL